MDRYTKVFFVINLDEGSFFFSFLLKIKSLEDRIHKLREKEDRFSKYDEPTTLNNNNNNGELSSPDSTPPVPIKNGHLRDSIFYDSVIIIFSIWNLISVIKMEMFNFVEFQRS